MIGSKVILSIADMSDDEVQGILNRARSFAAGEKADHHELVVGLLFLRSSLRTQAGFAVAAARLGGTSVTVTGLRSAESMSAPEAVSDTVRTLSGMVDVLVIRADQVLDRRELETCTRCHILNGGDVVEHPSQALIDILAIEEERGPIGDLHLCISGDLSMRTVASLMSLLERRPPRMLTTTGPPSLRDVLKPGPGLAGRFRWANSPELLDVDVLYLPGLPASGPAGDFDTATRRRYGLQGADLAQLPRDAVVLSPLPVIDEIERGALADPRVRVFEQSDRGLFVRMAILDWMMSS